MPSELKEAIKAFIEYYNYQRYHEGLGNVTPYDEYTGRHLKVIESINTTNAGLLYGNKVPWLRITDLEHTSKSVIARNTCPKAHHL